jgi:hypothetical protein
MSERLGWPGRWANGILYEEGGLPVHLYPFPVNAEGQGPCDPDETFRFICWCGSEGCVGKYDTFGFPVVTKSTS